MAKETEFKILFLKKAKASVLVILSKHVKNGTAIRVPQQEQLLLEWQQWYRYTSC